MIRIERCRRPAAVVLPVRVLPALILLALALSVLALPTVAQERSFSRGPFGVQEMNPLYRLFLTPRSVPADVVEAGRWRVDVPVTYSNIFEASESRTHHQLFDMERLATTVRVAYGLSDRWQLGAELGMQTSWGGFLDPFIQEWHEIFSLPNGGREDFEDNAYALRLVRDGQAAVDVPDGTRMEDVRLSVQRVVAGGRGAGGTLALRGILKLPTGSDEVGTGRIDGGVELIGRRSWTVTHVHGALGAVTLNAPDRLDPFVSRSALVAYVAVEREVAARVSLLGQVNTASRYVGGFGVEELDHVPFNLTLGAAGELAGWGWHAGFAEDIVPNSPAVDFALYLQLSRVR